MTAKAWCSDVLRPMWEDGEVGGGGQQEPGGDSSFRSRIMTLAAGCSCNSLWMLVFTETPGPGRSSENQQLNCTVSVIC